MWSHHPLRTAVNSKAKIVDMRQFYQIFFFFYKPVFLLYLSWCFHKISQRPLDFPKCCVQDSILWLPVHHQNLCFYFCYIDRKEILIQHCVLTLSACLYKSLCNPGVWYEREREQEVVFIVKHGQSIACGKTTESENGPKGNLQIC